MGIISSPKWCILIWTKADLHPSFIRQWLQKEMVFICMTCLQTLRKPYYWLIRLKHATKCSWPQGRWGMGLGMTINPTWLPRVPVVTNILQSVYLRVPGAGLSHLQIQLSLSASSDVWLLVSLQSTRQPHLQVLFSHPACLGDCLKN